MARELVNLTSENDQLKEQLEDFPELEAKFKVRNSHAKITSVLKICAPVARKNVNFS